MSTRRSLVLALHDYRNDHWPTWMAAGFDRGETISIESGNLGSIDVFQSRGLAMQEQVARIGAHKARLNVKPTILMQNCPSEFLQIHAHIWSLTFYADPDYDSLTELLKRVEERGRKANKDGEDLDWEPGGRCGHLMQ